jgi:hypothetical protein
MSQAHATKVLNNQDSDRAKNKKRAVSDSFNKTQLHSGTATSQNLQKEAESMLQAQMNEVNHYSSIRIDSTTWWVLRSTPRKVGDSPITCFERVRVVTIDENGSMRCSCGYPAQYGIPDQHTIHVATCYGEDFVGFSHHDVDVRHHNSYCHLVATKDKSELSQDEKEVRDYLIKLRQLELQVPFAPSVCSFEVGPKFAVGSGRSGPHVGTYDEVWERISMMKSKEPVALNYSSTEVALALMSLEGGINTAAGLSQSQHNCEDYNDEFDDDDAAMFSSWDATAAAAPRPTASNYEKAVPAIKELQQALENSTPSSFAKAMSAIEGLTESLNVRRKLLMEEAAPKGNTMSGKLKAKNPKRKHVKQH